MRRLTAGERRVYAESHALLGVRMKVTPTMRRRVDELALWLAEGDASKVKETRKLVLELLGEAARMPAPPRGKPRS